MFLDGYLGASAGTQRNSAFMDLIVADKNMEDMDSHTSGSGLLHYFGKQFLAFFLRQPHANCVDQPLGPLGH